MTGDAKFWLGAVFNADESQDNTKNYNDQKNFARSDYSLFEFFLPKKIQFHFFTFLYLYGIKPTPQRRGIGFKGILLLEIG